MPRLTPTQRRVWDAMDGGLHLMYWPGGLSPGHFQLGTNWGYYDHKANVALHTPRRIAYTAIQGMVKAGCFIEVDRTNADATSTGHMAAVRYRRNPKFTPT